MHILNTKIRKINIGPILEFKPNENFLKTYSDNVFNQKAVNINTNSKDDRRNFDEEYLHICQHFEPSRK